MIAKRDGDGTWHVTDPDEAACGWTPPEGGAEAMETGTLAMVAGSIDGPTCDDCDWGAGPSSGADAGEPASPDR